MLHGGATLTHISTQTGGIGSAPDLDTSIYRLDDGGGGAGMVFADTTVISVGDRVSGAATGW